MEAVRAAPIAVRRGPYAAVLGAATSCYAALGAVLAILPRYVPGALGGGSTAVGIAVGAPALTGLLARPLGGRAADRFGPRAPLLAGAAAMAAGAIPAQLFATFGALLASRLAVGAGEGIMMSAGVAWLLALAGRGRRGRTLGHIGLANYGGLALGPLLAAALGGAGAAHAFPGASVALPLLGAAAVLWLDAPRGDGGQADAPMGSLLRRTAPAGLGLLLVNVGYVSALSFGADVTDARGTGLASLIVPVFSAVVIVTRTLGGGVPDRLGARRTVMLFAGAEVLGLLAYAASAATVPALAALLVLSAGQSLAVPGLGLLALARVEPADQGAAAGLFFAWFDAGVGVGGPAVGAGAALEGPSDALSAAGLAVGAVVALAAIDRRHQRPT